MTRDRFVPLICLVIVTPNGATVMRVEPVRASIN